ncbi:MAG TPA: hypothetical protein VMK12_23100, partial [Anaeromyxobacteraceae bacterium]|nr:hypothetical protein [Anaeromyxobacteraceae bacterium]
GGSENITVMHQLRVQLIGCASVAAWSAGMTWIALKVADVVTVARADEEQETIGLDLTSHEERGYYY